MPLLCLSFTLAKVEQKGAKGVANLATSGDKSVGSMGIIGCPTDT